MGLFRLYFRLFSTLNIVYKLFSARHCTLKNLIPGNSYRVYIRTINSATIDSDWNYQDFETKSDIPSPPDNISVTAVQSQMVSIAWKAPSDNGSMITGKSTDNRIATFLKWGFLGYEVEVCSGSSKSIQYTQPSQLTFEHSNLNANTEYTFRVAATNKIGRSGKFLNFRPKKSVAKSSPMSTKYFQVSHLVVPFVLLLQVPIFPYFLLSFCIIFPLSDNKLN